MPTSQLVTVGSDAHNKMLVTGLWNYFLAKHKVDCNIEWDGFSVRVHRLLLDVFLTPANVVTPTDPATSLEHKNCLDLMVEFLYQGRVLVQQEQLQGLLNVAKESNFQMLIEAVQDAIMLEKDKAKINEILSLHVEDEPLKTKNRESVPSRDGSITSANIVDDQVCDSVPFSIQTEEDVTKPLGRACKSKSKPKKCTNTRSKKDTKLGNKDTMDDQVCDSGPSILAEECVLKPDKPRSSVRQPLRRKAKPFKLRISLKNAGNMDKDWVPANLESTTGKGDDPDLSSSDSTNSADFVDEPSESAPCSSSVSLDEPNLAVDNPRPRQRKRSNSLKCTVESCGMTFISSNKLKTHHLVNHVTEKLHICDQCPKTFKYKRSLKNHLLAHTDIRPFKCDIDGCEKAYRAANILKRHKKSHSSIKAYERNKKSHSSIKTYECNLCDKTFKQRRYMLSHQRFVHFKERPYCCDECGKTFSLKPSLDTHKRTHTGERPYKCTVDSCEKAFKSRGVLRSHLRNHDTEKLYKCDQCPMSFSFRICLRDHLVRHTGIKAFKCQIGGCEKAFYTVGQLVGHKKTHAPKNSIKPHVCTICGSAFRLRKGLIVHQNSVHATERPFCCDVCGRTFTLKRLLTHHKKSHSSIKGHVCNVCGMTFKRKLAFTKHERVDHNKNKVVQLFKCDQCPKTFRSKNSLSMHSQTHSGVTPVQCELCGEGLRAAYLLKAHMKSHTEEHPYKCNLCDRSFVTSLSLRLHAGKHVEKKFQCSVCPKMFRHSSQKKRHENRHVKERRGRLPLHKCNVCSEGFDTLATLKEHSLQHANDHPYQCDICFKQYAKQSQFKEHARCHQGKTYDCVLCNKTFVTRGGIAKHKNKFHANGAEPGSHVNSNGD